MRSSLVLVLPALLFWACGDEPGLNAVDVGPDEGVEASDGGLLPDIPPVGVDAIVPPDEEMLCETHSDCPCPEGICVSSGECWCPPCSDDSDCWDELICRGGQCTALPVACVGPVRLQPEFGPTTGGTVLVIQGMEFYIGALEWWAQVGDGPGLRQAYGIDVECTACAISFVAPPMPAGTYPVRVWYGGPPPLGDESRTESVGTFTYVVSDEPIGVGPCRSAAQCEGGLYTCDLGMGQCVPNLCLSLNCPESGCDSVEGCLPAVDTCATDNDCRLIRSECTCDAVGAASPLDELTNCTLGGCEGCDENRCDVETIESACIQGVCQERRGDPEGLSCADLAFRTLTGSVDVDGLVSSVSSATDGTNVALAWTIPSQAGFRNGIVGLTTFEPAALDAAEVLILDDGQGLDSHPAIAWNGDSYGVVWLNERSPASLLFQRVDVADGGGLSLTGASEFVDDRMDESILPRLLPRSGGFHAFWGEHNWGSDDGLYHVELTADGNLLSEIDRLAWVAPSLESFAAESVGDHFLVAWPNSTPGRDGVFATEFPLTEAPVRRLADNGAGVALTTNTAGYTAVWRDLSGPSRQRIAFRTIDIDGEPLTDAVRMSNGSVFALSPQVSYLGGFFIVSWFELDLETDEYQLRLRTVRDDGSDIPWGDVEVIEGLAQGVQFHQRVNDEVYVGWVDPGDGENRLRMGVFQCVDF